MVRAGIGVQQEHAGRRTPVGTVQGSLGQRARCAARAGPAEAAVCGDGDPAQLKGFVALGRSTVGPRVAGGAGGRTPASFAEPPLCAALRLRRRAAHILCSDLSERGLVDVLGVQGGQREAVLSRLGESTARLLCPQNAAGVFPLKGPARSEMQPQCEERVWSWGGGVCCHFPS